MKPLDRVANLARLLGVRRDIDRTANSITTKRRNRDIAKLAEELKINYIVEYEQKPALELELKKQLQQKTTQQAPTAPKPQEQPKFFCRKCGVTVMEVSNQVCGSCIQKINREKEELAKKTLQEQRAKEIAANVEKPAPAPKPNLNLDEFVGRPEYNMLMIAANIGLPIKIWPDSDPSPLITAYDCKTPIEGKYYEQIAERAKSIGWRYLYVGTVFDKGQQFVIREQK